MHSAPPCILFEDDHLLVVNKPAGMNTHAPAPFAGEGLYDWLRHREPRWARLAIVHRLDKETSGVLVFGKTTLANRSLTGQFAAHTVRKKYQLLTDRPVSFRHFTARSNIVRAGAKYAGRPTGAGESAETRFTLIERHGSRCLLAAEPVTGKTHQIRVHAAEHGFPILGDALYGGARHPRACLHAEALEFEHPASGARVHFKCGADFEKDISVALRAAIIDPSQTDAFRLIHGAADGWPGWHVEHLGRFLLLQADSSSDLNSGPWPILKQQMRAGPGPHAFLRRARGAYLRTLTRRVREKSPDEVSPDWIAGEEAPEEFVVRENGVRFLLRFQEGYSVGLFLDQRDNRRRFLINHVAAGFPLFEGGAAGKEILNTFAYTCGFSVCAAKAGARTTNLDLSKKYLEWGKRNFAVNGLEPDGHDFLHGDAFDWLRRLGKKNRRFDAILLDPPTFSQSKQTGAFRAARDYGKLVTAALPLLQSGGVLLASTNAASLAPEDFLERVRAAAANDRRQIVKEHYVPQPPDFPVTREEPAYLKTVWMRLGGGRDLK